MNCIAVITTVGSRDDARRIAQALVERRLVACAQISAIESLYHWDGALQDDAEFRLLLKTVDTQYDAVERAIRELHPYDLPAIYALPIDRIHAPYAAWVRDGCSGRPWSGDRIDRSGDRPRWPPSHEAGVAGCRRLASQALAAVGNADR